jgi:tryptophan halogenase
MIKKITFLGRGNAGCLSALHYAYYTRKNKNIEIELIYDPETPPEKVGQATLLEVPSLLWRALGINWYHNPVCATNKLGILYENWGKKNKYIFHPFNLDQTAMHYNPKELQNTILNSKLFKVKESKVDNANEIDSTFVFDCRGRKINDYSKYDLLDNPLNAVLLGQSNQCDPKQLWTRAVATPDGWTFVIPNTTNTTSYGYLYNDEITSIEEASKNFKEIFKLAEQGIYLNEKVDNFKFKNYMAKNPIDKNIILGGNRLFFLEPLESTAIQSYLYWARLTFDYIVEEISTTQQIERIFKEYILKIQNFIYWHYLKGSKYNSPFWKKVVKYKIKDDNFYKIIDYVKSNKDIDIRDKNIARNNEIYGQFAPIDFKNWYDGTH